MDKPIIAVTMAYNEGDTLRRWLAHYRAEVGDVLVIDHGSDDGSTDRITDRLRLPRSPFDDGERAELLNEMQRTLLRSFGAVIYTDADELLLADPERFATLRDYVVAMDATVARAVGFDVLHIRSCEPALDPARTVFEQRNHVWMRSGLCKPLIIREPTTWAPGFHACTHRAPADPALWLFHTKSADFGAALRRQAVTRALPWSDRALASEWGAHQRQSDEWAMRQQFIDPENVLRQQGAPAPFDAQAPAEQFNATLHQVGDLWCGDAFNGAVMRMPAQPDFAIIQNGAHICQVVRGRLRAESAAHAWRQGVPNAQISIRPAAEVIDWTAPHQPGEDIPMRAH